MTSLYWIRLLSHAKFQSMSNIHYWVSRLRLLVRCMQTVIISFACLRWCYNGNRNAFSEKCTYCTLVSHDWGFLRAKPWISGGGISIFKGVIHWHRSLLHQFARAMTIDEYDVIIPVSCVSMTSQIKCGDITMLSQKDRPWRYWRNEQSILRDLCVHDIKKRVRNKTIYSLAWITIFGHSRGEPAMIFTSDEWKSLPNRLTRDKNRYSR